jgi:hypothetical protein
VLLGILIADLGCFTPSLQEKVGVMPENKLIHVCLRVCVRMYVRRLVYLLVVVNSLQLYVITVEFFNHHYTPSIIYNYV